MGLDILLIVRTIVLTLFVVFLPTAGWAKCPKPVEKNVDVSLHLVDRYWNEVAGPLNIGDLEISNNFNSDAVLRDTGYRLLVFPRGARSENFCSQGLCLKLIAERSGCERFSAYKIALLYTAVSGDVRPYEIPRDIGSAVLEFSDDATGLPLTRVNRAFDASVIGKIVNPVAK